MIPWVTSSSSLAGGGRGLGKSHGHEGPSTVYGSVSFTGSTEGGGGCGELNCGCLSGWWAGSEAPLLLSIYLWPWVSPLPGGQSWLHCLPYHSWVLWICEFSCCSQRARIAGTTWAISLFLPFNIFQSTHLYMWRSMEFPRSWCWADAPFLHCGCFTGCRLKGRDKGSTSLYHDADLTLALTHFIKLL